MDEQEQSSSFSQQDENRTEQQNIAKGSVDEELENALDNFARTYNLTTQNVKNIIYHIVKNPKTFATLIQNDPEAVDGLRITRARLKELERISKSEIPIELKPISLPRTFLDLNYNDEDEVDSDYQPRTDECVGDDDQSDSCSTNADCTPCDANVEIIEETANAEDEQNQIQFNTVIDDPIYIDFVKSCLTDDFQFTNNLFDDEDDDEYNVTNELDEFLRTHDEEEPDEYRKDRSTEIPRWELNEIWNEFKNNDEVSAKKRRVEDPNSANSSKNNKSLRSSNENSVNSSRLENVTREQKDRNKEIEGCSAANSGQPQPDDPLPSTSTDLSCSLLADCVAFSDEEILTLRTQLEKHVQLLCQCIVGSYGEAALVNARNSALNMLHELDKEMYKGNETSLFRISTLPGAVFSSHDIIACQGADLGIDLVQTLANTYPKLYINRLLSQEVMWVFARSSAIRYHDMVPEFRFMSFDDQNGTFLPSEDILLSLALFQLKHVKHSTWFNWNGKYQLISRNFLPNKTVSQIRNHLKNIRSNSSPSPIQTIVCRAEKGRLNIDYRFESEAPPQNDLPLDWPTNRQSFWLQGISEAFRKGYIQVVSTTDNDESVSKNSRNEVQKPRLRTRLQENAAQCNAESAGLKFNHAEDSKKLQHRSTSDQCRQHIVGSASPTTATETSNTKTQKGTNAPNHQKSTRKQNKQIRGIQALGEQSILNETRQALIGAINADLKQRLFMHQDKLRLIQRTISTEALSTAQKFERISAEIGQTHPKLLLLISALVPADELPLFLQNDRQRSSYRTALEMILMIQTYMIGSGSATTMRNTFKFLRDSDIHSEEALAKALAKHLGQDNPLWHILRRNMFDERFSENIQDSEYEIADLNDTLDDVPESEPIFETATLHYHNDREDRGGLRLRHGRITLEHNGRRKNVNIGFASDSAVGPLELTWSRPWSREMDSFLLTGYAKHGNSHNSVEEFMEEFSDSNITVIEANRRLSCLLSLAQTCS